MDLTCELLLPYQGLNGFDGLCHIRVYEQPGRLPVVIAGGLDDNPGTSITNAIEMLATTVKRSLFSDGREFHLIEHYGDGIDGRPAPTYSLIHFSHRPLQEHPDERDNIEGDFRHPYWEPIEDIEHLVGCALATWTPGTYTARAVAGQQGEQLRSELVENAHRIREEILTAIGPGDL